MKSTKAKKRAVSALACLVVFIMTYSLILPAIAIDKNEAASEAGITIEEAAEKNIEEDGSVSDTASKSENASDAGSSEENDASAAKESADAESGSDSIKAESVKAKKDAAGNDAADKSESNSEEKHIPAEKAAETANAAAADSQSGGTDAKSGNVSQEKAGGSTAGGKDTDKADSAKKKDDSKKGTSGKSTADTMPEVTFRQTFKYKEIDKNGTEANKKIQVVVKAKEGTFPKGATMEIKGVFRDENLEDAVDHVLEEKKDSARTNYRAVSIRFYDKAGKAVEPEKKAAVQITAEDVTEMEHPMLLCVTDQDAAAGSAAASDQSGASQKKEAELLDTFDLTDEEADEVDGNENTIKFDTDQFAKTSFVITGTAEKNEETEDEVAEAREASASVQYVYEEDGKEVVVEAEDSDDLNGAEDADADEASDADGAVDEDEMTDSDEAVGEDEMTDADEAVGEDKMTDADETVDEAEMTDSDETVDKDEMTVGDEADDEDASSDADENLDISEDNAEESETNSDLLNYEHVLDFEGRDYTVTVRYNDNAGIPEGAELSVSEITEHKSGYISYKNRALDTIREDQNNENLDLSYIRLFDIKIKSGEEEIQPEQGVSVTVNYHNAIDVGVDEDMQAVHFGTNGPEVLTAETSGSEDGVEEVTFGAEGFSVYAIVYTVDFHYEVDGKMYEFSIPGGGFVSLEHVVEVLGIVRIGESTADSGENEVNKGENESENDVYNVGEETDVDDNGENGNTYEESISLNNIEVSEAAKKFVADVASVEFSNPELVWAGKVDETTTVGGLKEANELKVQYSAELTEEQIAEINSSTVEAGDWALISVLPFTSEESLTVTMKNGNQFVVRVTDAQKTAVSQLEDEQEYVLYIVRNNHYYALDKDGHTVQVPNDDLESLSSDYLWTYEKKQSWRECSTWHNHSGTNYLDVYWTMEDGDNVPADKGGSASKNYPVVTSQTSDNWEPIENLYPYGGGFLFRDLNDNGIYLAYVGDHVRAIDARSYAAVHHTSAPQAVTIYIYKQGTAYTVDVQVNDNEMGSVQYVHDATSLESSIDTPVISVPTEKVESGNKKVLDNLIAVPKEGYVFTGWTVVKEEWDTTSNVTDWGTSQTEATIRPTVSADKMTLQANFAPAVQYKFTVETSNPGYGLVGGTDATDKEVSGHESYEGKSTTVIGGTGKNPYAITATRKPGSRFVGWRLTNENGDFIDSYAATGDVNNDWTFTLDARTVSLPSDNCTLTAVFEDKSDNEVNKKDIDKLLDDWAENLKGDLTDMDKTAHVVDPNNRIYQVNLTAASKKWIAYPSITLDIVTDTSRSMYFPANMVEYGNFKSDGLETWLNSRTAEEKKKVYYVVSDLYDRSNGSKENAATVYAVWWNGSNWIYKDSSYKYHADFNTGGTEWTVNSTNVNNITIKKGTGTSETNYQRLTGIIYTSSNPPTSYTSNNVDASINDEYWSRLDYLYKAVMTATETLKAIDPSATITLTTFNKASRHVGELKSTEEEIYNQLTSEISLSGGTRQDEGLYTSRTGLACGDNAGAGTSDGVRTGLQGTTKDKFVIAITDGAPNFGNTYKDDPWEKAIKPQADKLKKIQDADGYLTLMTLCLGSKYVGTNESEFASLSSDPSKYAKNANDGQAIVDAIEELVQHMLKKANLFGTATDTLDPAFYPVTVGGDPVQENLYYDNNGELIGDGRTKPTGYTPCCQWTRDGEQWKITYYNQTFKWADQGGWDRSFYVKAKENFLGGNAIETNDAASITVTDAIIRDDQSEEHHTLKDKDGNAKPVTKTLPTPHVNVRQLLMNENNTRWTVYVETEVSPEPQIQKLFENILVEELVEKSSAERVTVENNMIKDGNYMRPAVSDETKPETFYLHTVIRDLTPTDWSNLKNPPDPEKPYIDIPYNGDKAYGHNAGVIRLTLTKTGKKANYETHNTSDSTSDKEEYVLTAQYIPHSASVMLAAHNLGQATDEQKAKDDALWHTTFGESSGTEIRNGRPSTNKHIIDLFVRGLALTKTDETFNNGLAGAVFELYRPAIGDEGGSEDLPDGVPAGYVLGDTLDVDDNGVVYKNGIKLLNSPKTTYYLVEKTPPEGYIKHDGAIPVELEITNHYVSPVANGATPVTTDGGEVPDVLYNWYQKAKLSMPVSDVIIRTSSNYDSNDPSTNWSDEEIEASSLYEVMYYRIKNEASSVDIEIHKVDDSGDPLPGATFKLTLGHEIVPISNAETDVVVEPKVPGETVTIEGNKFTIPAGGVKIKNLASSENEYAIVEVTPPAGHVITSDTPVTFTVSAGQITEEHVAGVTYAPMNHGFTIPNPPGAALPNTGGPGTTLIYLFGIMLTGLAGAGLVMKRRRRKAA